MAAPSPAGCLGTQLAGLCPGWGRVAGLGGSCRVLGSGQQRQQLTLGAGWLARAGLAVGRQWAWQVVGSRSAAGAQGWLPAGQGQGRQWAGS